MGKNDPQPQRQFSDSRTTQELSPEQRQLLNLAMPGFMNFAAQTPQRYSGSTIAGFTDPQRAAQGMALGASTQQGNLANAGQRAADFWLSDAIWRPENNPALQGTIDAATRPIMDTLTRTTLPAIRSGAIASGNFGSSRQGIAEGLAAGEASRAVGDTASRVANQNYATNVEAQQRAMGLIPQMQESLLAPARTTSAVGDVQQALQQALLGEQVGNFNFDQLAPFLQSRELLALLQGVPGGSVVSTGQSEATVPQRNPLTSALGGAATGASLGSIFGPIGTGLGAVGGGLLSFL